MRNSFFQKENNKVISYSELINEISSGNIESLILIPSRNQVLANFKNGNSVLVSTFSRDQTILSIAKTTATPLIVKDVRKEEAMSNFIVNYSIILVFIFILSLFFRKILNIANKNLSFVSGNSRIHDSSTIDTRFEDFAGNLEAVEEVKEVVSFLKEPEIYNKLGASIPKGILLVGPPGTGKTLLAQAIAGEAECPFFSTSGSEFVELFVGIGASRVRSLFLKAREKTPSIIFIDEIDSIGRKRGYGIGGGNDEREQTLNQLLTQMDGINTNSGLIVIAATNRYDVLDSALTRPGRFDRCIEVTLPDIHGRLSILSLQARTKPLLDNVNLKELASKTVGFSGAELGNLLNEAAILTARDNKKKISNYYLDLAFERITLGLSHSSFSSYSHKRIIAYYEIGRALVSLLLPHTDKLNKISILRRGNNLGGYSQFIPLDSDISLHTQKYYLSSIILAMAGRATELLMLGKSEVTQLSVKDIEKATYLARQMITKYGFQDLSFISVSKRTANIDLGIDLLRSKSINANKTYNLLDQKVISLLKSSLNQALELLDPFQYKIDLLADALLEDETMSVKRFSDMALLSVENKQS
ncbi:ATP-dependent metallopeptidase FtsH/Yme1/Tma family protein [Prochlorococcus marinus]|uniref:ATP-dependent metallopeptidase FtsH/Yme1/Tma family protein n=1 Tax=Prochlorococcus marinus TaxID=1219 RepID=UPI0022B44AE4|nr:AAA family ATPase [Prochlorococcus marinus]